MKIAVLSDLHLREGDVTLQRNFARLLKQLYDLEKISDLWLLGDIFDLLVGPYEFWKKTYPEIFESLHYLRKNGVHILWCEGNHDFHIDGLLEKMGIDVVDGKQTYLVGKKNLKVYVAHGDLVNQNDKAYMAWRGITRNKTYRKILNWTPGILAKKYLKPWAEGLSAKSRARSKTHSIDLHSLYRNFAEGKFRESFFAVFMGHCHVEDLYPTSNGFYLNLGSALDGELRYAIWDPDADRFPNVYKYSKMKP
jgi:UDP-2,3-diacylglucosamine hydrolase